MKLHQVKRIIILLCPLCLIMFANISTYNEHQTFRITSESKIGMLQYLPPDYQNNSDKYPLVIFLHGIIEKGIDSTDPDLLESTIHSVDNVGPPRHVKEGYQFPFILLCPQLKFQYETWPSWYVVEVINWAKNNLRIDEKRIHITGLSLGGGGAFEAIEDYPDLFASAAPVCAYYNSTSKACSIAHANMAVWAFHGMADPQIPASSPSTIIKAINACSGAVPSRAKLTVYPDVKHNAWDRAYMPDHSYHEENLYDWMMTVENTINGANYLPTADAGTDQMHNELRNISLAGKGADTDGEITAYKWTKLSGPSAVIANATSQNTSVTLSRTGVYVFKLTVTDDNGDSDSDYVRVTVNG